MRTLTILIALAAPAAPAAAQQLDLSWHSVDTGGGISAGGASGSMTLIGAIGQHDAGPAQAEMSAGRFTLVGGLLPVAGRRCPADCDGSGSLEFFDFLCFQDQFARGEAEADCDGSGSLDFFDFLCFQNEFALGCP